VRASGASLADWPLHAPAIEAEIALRLAVDVDAAQAARLTPDSTQGLVDAMTVSIEVVDSRWREGSQAPALLRLADAQSHGALVLGDWVRCTPRDWATQVCEVHIGGQTPTVKRGTHSLGDPAWLLASWLQHATRKGASVPAGTIVTTGTWVGVLPVLRGDEVRVDFPGVGTASLTL
jgi:2-keto-4-pentenoate hydratase